MRIGLPRRNPANASSSTTGGSGAVAAYVSAGSPPTATATGMRRPHFAACTRPCLWRCQCIPAVVPSYTCTRYMPTLKRRVSGSRVNTSGSVMNGPPSSGHVVSTGSFERSGGSMTTCCDGASPFTRRGIADAPALASDARRPSLPPSETGKPRSIVDRRRCFDLG